ncbi:DUF308 domain-containing protein [Sphingomonas sp. GCM10030256]|uniref:DUF308 domain-containing protein n=1 Tax=Sphingomonas sp. GCM10030256 TaxID=3273427 RepID=UPI00360EBFD7
MTETQAIREPRPRRYHAMLTAAWVIILLAGGAALLPLLERTSGARLVGALLLAAGVAELMAGTLRKSARVATMMAGAVTMVAGVLFLLRPETKFLPTLYVITAWLLIRSLANIAAAVMATGSTRRWSFVSGLTDLLLGLLSLAGLSAYTLVVTLFGPTPQVIANFAWFLAVSFVTTGIYLLEVGNCEREAAGA